MVRCINVHNVNQGLAEGLRLLATSGVYEDSRNGPVLVAPSPVITTYLNPTSRVLFSPLRDANPFFHVMETLWMLAGRNDLPWLAQFNKNMLNYSDDGGATQPGTYGYRWRKYFGYDQLPELVALLKKPGQRRAVLTMWDGGCSGTQYAGDIWATHNGSADVPCNTQAYFDVRDGKLNMTVTCRSNDIWWGAYGANAVHFSFLLEYMAAMVGVKVGVYRQFSNNFHLYPGKLPSGDLHELADNARHQDRYTLAAGPHTARTQEPDHPLRQVALVTDPACFDNDLQAWMTHPGIVCINEFFGHVATHMWNAWAAYKQGDYRTAIDHAEHIKAGDWSIACVEWLERRHARKLERERTV